MTTQKVTNVAVSTATTEPLRGILELECSGAFATFELNEEFAHQLCRGLERFLTQVPGRARAVRFA